jgi:hypothetical protein
LASLKHWWVEAFFCCHPERSAAESKDPVMRPSDNATGFLDFARNDFRVTSFAFPI